MKKPWTKYMNEEGWLEYIAQGVITGPDAVRLISAKLAEKDVEIQNLEDRIVDLLKDLEKARDPNNPPF